MESAPRRNVIPPAVEAERMRRYSVVLMIVAFVLLGLNIQELTPARLLWFGAILLAVMGIVLGAAGVVMRGLQWHYDKLADEFRGKPRVTSTDVSGVTAAPAAAEAPDAPSRPA
jgi:NhaP-type Na+/H+ or K+/H+ antiporter